jgi:hypothetical protein
MGPRFLLAELFPFMFLRTLPIGFMASLLTAALLLSMSDLAIAQRSGVRSGVIDSAPTDSKRRDRWWLSWGPGRSARARGSVYPYSNPCIAWTVRLWVRVC